MNRILGVSLFALLLAGCMTAPPAPKKAASEAPPVLIGTPTAPVMTPALEALEKATTQDAQLLVRFTVQPDGSVTDPEARFSKLSPQDTATVLAAIQQWHFKPAREGGRAVARPFIYPVFFGPDAARHRTVFMCRNQKSVYEPARRCRIVLSGDWRIYRVDPVYPPELLSRRLAGSVTLGFDIGPDGRAVDPKVVAANPAGLFDAAAVAAVKAWYFERVDGKTPVQAESHPHVTVSVQFVPPAPVSQTGQ